MIFVDAETLMFFDARPEALSLYEALEEKIREICPDMKKRVQKTQITFTGRYVFACASFLRAKRKADMPDPFITLTLGLPCPLESERAAVQTEPYPGRWTVHIVIGKKEEIDEELLNWIGAAWTFAESKGKKAGKNEKSSKR